MKKISYSTGNYVFVDAWGKELLVKVTSTTKIKRNSFSDGTVFFDFVENGQPSKNIKALPEGSIEKMLGKKISNKQGLFLVQD